MEDRHAWARGGPEEIVPSIFRIPLPLPSDALRAVNVYAIEGSDGIGLVDGGWFRPEAEEALLRGLAALGAGFGDVTMIAATHFHPDHYTLAVEIGRRTGCPVLLGEGERATIDSILDGDRDIGAFAAALQREGVPRDIIDRDLRPTQGGELFDRPGRWVFDGERVAVGGIGLLALATPGHTRGHLCFADDERGLLFSGDHVLPHITPSIGYESHQEGHLPLASYLTSLRRVRERPDAMMLPAHGPIGPSVHARVDELLQHHDQRLQACVDAVARGATTAYEIAMAIRWTSRGRSLTDLPRFDQLMAVHETVAHLEVLAMQDRVEVAQDDGVNVYAVV